MLPYERKKIIENYIDQNEETTIEEVCSIMPTVSESTIRRDLKLLEDEGAVSIYYGGLVKRNKYYVEEKIEDKRILNMDAKKKIATYAASLVKPNETVFMDSGSSILEMLQYLHPSVKIVTTSLDIVVNNKKNLEIYLLGGNVSTVRNSVYGPSTLEQVKDFVFDKAFLGANGICERYGITTPSLEETMLKKQIINTTNNVYFLIDNSKIGHFSTCKISNVDENHVIMESENSLSEKFNNIIFPE